MLVVVVVIDFWGSFLREWKVGATHTHIFKKKVTHPKIGLRVSVHDPLPTFHHSKIGWSFISELRICLIFK